MNKGHATASFSTTALLTLLMGFSKDKNRSNEQLLLLHSGNCKVNSTVCKEGNRRCADNSMRRIILFASLSLRNYISMKIINHTELETLQSEKEPGAWRQTIASYINLMKPHVTVLLLGTTVATMAIAQQGMPNLLLILATLVGGTMAAGSANCINCYIDRDIDQLMTRTQRRSLPSGRVRPTQALIFGVVLGAGSFVVFSSFVNLLSAELALAAILFYVFIYTLWLKRSSTQNIVIGGAAGAVPVLIGWSAVTNSVSLSAIWLFAIVFYWTPPHFWALSLLIEKDYARANVPMLPVVMGERETKKQILLYSLMLLAVTLILFAMHTMGYFYLVCSTLLGGILVYMAIRLLIDSTRKWARTLFWYSNCYLALIFAVMVLDRVIHFPF